MPTGLLLTTILLNAAFVVAALGCGSAVLRRLERTVTAAGEPPTSAELSWSTARLGASVLIGFGILSYAGVMLGLVRCFYPVTLAATGVLTVVLTRSELIGCASFVRARIAKPWGGADPVTALAVAATVLLIVFRYLVALAPPTAYDGLAYHLPQAHELAGSHALGANVGGHPFYGSIPKLIEVLYAEAIALSGDALAQVLHFTLLLGLLTFTWGTVARFFDRRAAALSVLALVCFGELVRNATGSMIDAGVVAFEVGGVLAAASWVESRSSMDAVRAASLLGLAAGAKYSALASVALCALIGTAVCVHERWAWSRARSAIAGLGGIIVAAAGFWYIKNLVKYGNPTYPLYFGHRGISEDAYAGIVADVQQFGPRTLSAFAGAPSRLLDAGDGIAFAAFYVAPLSLLLRRRFIVALLAYAAVFLPYWFFIATHQLRFAMPALCILLIAAALALAPLPRKAYLVAAIAALVYAGVSGPAQNVRKLTAPFDPVAYAVGRESQDEYLTRQFGCQYAATAWLQRQPGRESMLDLWTQWHDPNVSYYANRHALVAGTPDRPWQDLSAELRRSGVRFYYVRLGTRAAWSREQLDSAERAWFVRATAADHALSGSLTPRWRSEDCRVSELTP